MIHLRQCISVYMLTHILVANMRKIIRQSGNNLHLCEPQKESERT